MLNKILNEELGISNEVVRLVSKIKSVIGSDYNRNKDDKNLYVKLKITTLKKLQTFCNNIIIDNIKIQYYVVDGDKYENYLSSYYHLYLSSFDLDTNEIILFLHSNNNKIYWGKCIEALQHEVEHWFEQQQKGKKLLSDKDIAKYQKYANLRKSSDPYERNIGLIYYYYTKVERNAIMNGLYAKIMDFNEYSYVVNPEDVLKDDNHYNNIKGIETVLNRINMSKTYKNTYKFYTDKNDINFNSFLKVMNYVVNEYIKKFGRTIYKARKDLQTKYKNIIN